MPDKTDDLGIDEVQDKVDDMNAKGYMGYKADPLPNEHYTVDGRIADDKAGKCTHPENDSDLEEGGLGNG